MSQPSPARPAAAFAALCVVVLAAVGAYVVWTRGGPSPAPVTSDMGSSFESVAAVQRRPHIVFRHTALDAAYGRVMLAALDDLERSRAVTPLTCDRVHVAAGRGVCLASDRGLRTTYRALVFDETFAVRHELPLPGVPSRVRVSPDGRRAGITVFLAGDSYALAGGFSTRAIVIDTETGRNLGNLEEYAVSRDGRPFKAVDFNFWGVTFLDASRFYATLGTGGEAYLVEGNVDEKVARVVHAGVECPSLSPDRTRVVFKKRVTSGMRLEWRVAVLDLATWRETLVAETASVDDQSEWLDDGHVVYARPSATRAASTDVWVVPADGSGSPRVLVTDAWSPALVPPVP